jgi:hypothetical protein
MPDNNAQNSSQVQISANCNFAEYGNISRYHDIQ